jgi:hypothetical protein
VVLEIQLLLFGVIQILEINQLHLVTKEQIMAIMDIQAMKHWLLGKKLKRQLKLLRRKKSQILKVIGLMAEKEEEPENLEEAEEAEEAENLEKAEDVKHI